MVAVLNLATYAYDDRVRLAAQMVLDYISAKVAVSSNNLQRSPPYRRRNEAPFFGPLAHNGDRSFSDTPLTNDPQTGFYSMLAGNTTLWRGHAPGRVAYEMVNAGLRDYRVPTTILDLFVTPSHRRFYQRFHHSAPTVLGDTSQFADELYAGSPDYLISAGGHPTYFSSIVNLTVGGGDFLGDETDRGVAQPTIVLPTSFVGPSTSLSGFSQFGQYGTDITVTNNMGVAPDFACGAVAFVPEIIVDGSPWYFLDSTFTGCYMAIRAFNARSGGVPTAFTPLQAFMDAGFMEIYDTSLHPGVKFDTFKNGVLARNGSTAFQFPGENTYVTTAGQRIQFRIAPGVGDILSTSDVSDSPEVWKGKFASGTIINSEQGSGIIDITNPALGKGIRLDMSDANFFAPRRTSESGQVEVSGVPNEVWVDFKYSGSGPTQNGDFGDPFKTLKAAQDHVAVGGKIKIVPGSTNEKVVLSKKMTITSFPGSATIGLQ
jgi:hypothetical protein